ncbi:MAG: hypothetical protein NXI23_15525 [Bacteroidetes bacterium]|jgi:hypothetical protein|nr:hypothetical protein [Bacteroidota bacterium]MDF1867237.1 hypothetical protein [Saprospiraceae bacterium]
MQSIKISYGNIFLTGITFLIISLSSGCIQFKQASLYDGIEETQKPAKPKDISLIVESMIYDEDATDVWGLEKDECQEAMISTTVAYSGNESIQMTWNRDAEGCKFAGIGIGWDGYAGKDLSEIMDFVAIQMHVRTQKGRAFGLPIVLTLEDYSGGMGFSYATNKYFERTAIDEEWQKVIVPLNSFEMEKENLDPTNIKQLQLELQQSGSIYLDDISLVFYEPEPQKPWMVEEVLPDPTAMPIQILDDAFINNNAWGLISDDCQTIEMTSAESTEGNQSLYAKWNDNGDCKLISFGVSWNKWRPVDITSIKGTTAIQFDIKTMGGNKSDLPIKVGFEDYERAKIYVDLKSEFVEGGQYTNEWKKVSVPLSAIPAGLDLTRIKQLYITMEQSGEVYIDDIKLVEL